jgi:2,5-diketo-D-gluconate reductase A
MAETSTNPVPEIHLNNGVHIPQLGFGVFQIKPAETEAAVSRALEIGYRHIDTAEMYRNEAAVGAAIAASGLPREEVFVTSKLSNAAHAPADTERAFDDTLAKLGTDRIDLFLIHWPLPTVSDFVPTWKALEQIYQDGRARAIGVSNFLPHHLRRLHEETGIRPAVDQIEVHPFFPQDELRQFCADHEIVVEAYSPIGQGVVLDDPTIVTIAEHLGRTPGQVVLRWHIQLGTVIFPKSTHPERVRENFDIFDFELSDADMASISDLGRDQRIGGDPDTAAFVPDNKPWEIR